MGSFSVHISISNTAVILNSTKYNTFLKLYLENKSETSISIYEFSLVACNT